MSSKKLSRERVEQILAQAKESVKVLEAIQKEGLNRAREYANEYSKIPAMLAAQIEASGITKKISRDQLVKKLGLATKEDLRELNDRIDDLASELRGQMSKLSRKPKN